jgi:hypothetical protein
MIAAAGIDLAKRRSAALSRLLSNQRSSQISHCYLLRFSLKARERMTNGDNRLVASVRAVPVVLDEVRGFYLARFTD